MLKKMERRKYRKNKLNLPNNIMPDLKVGNSIIIFDSFWQTDVKETVTKIINEVHSYNRYLIQTERYNWGGTDYRLSTPDKIKAIYKR